MMPERPLSTPTALALALGLVAALWVQTPTVSDASTRDAVAGRVFTLAALPNTSGSGSLAVAPDGTVWDAAGWRLRPGDLRPRRIIQRSSVVDVAALRDGSVIFSQSSRYGGVVWRRTPDGRTRVVAGRQTSAPTAAVGGDGGRAVETTLCSVGAVAALPDGGFLVVDDATRVRRVAADGTITTRYVVPGATAAYGCGTGDDNPAEYVKDLTVAPDGALIAATDSSYSDDSAYRLVRIGPSGTRRLLLTASGGVLSLAAAPDGSVLFAGDSGESVRRLDLRTGRSALVLPSAYAPEEEAPSVFDRDGVVAARFFDMALDGVAVAPDGGVLVTSDPLSGYVDRASRLHYVAPPTPTRLAVAAEPRTGRATTAGYTTRYRITRPARLVVTARTERGTIAHRVQLRVRRGRNVLGLRHRFRFGVYDVRVTARTGRARAQDTFRVYLGGTLPLPAARKLLVPKSIDSCDAYRAIAADDPEPCFGYAIPVRDDGCRRYSSRRADCIYSYRASRSSSRRCYHVAGVLRRDGTFAVVQLETPSYPGPSCTTRRLPRRPENLAGYATDRVLPEQPS